MKKKNIFIKRYFSFLAVFLIFQSFSCSLKYNNAEYDESSIPEFTFNDVNFDRYEDNNKTMHLNATKMEQYKDGNSIFAQNLDFDMMNDEGEITTKGHCNLLAADTDAEKYTLYENIEIYNSKDDMTVIAKNLKWNGKTEQLTSGRNDVVSIKKENTFMQGSGFSASGVSKTFSFTGVITGETQTNDEKEEEQQ